MSWNQLLEHRVNKSSLKHLSKDSGRCARYKPHDEPSEEFDDEHCLALQTICLYKFGKFFKIFIDLNHLSGKLCSKVSPNSTGWSPASKRIRTKPKRQVIT